MILTKMKNFAALYRWTFWFFAIGITTFSAIIFCVINFTAVPVRIASEMTEAGARDITAYIDDAELTFDMCTHIIETLAKHSSFSDAENTPDRQTTIMFAQNVDTVISGFMNSRETIDSYFYAINPDRLDNSHELFCDRYSNKVYQISILTDAAYISGEDGLLERVRLERSPFWTSLYNSMTGKMYLSYIVPLYRDNDYLGFCGINLDLVYLKKQYFTDYTPYRYSMLATEGLQVIAHPTLEAGMPLKVKEPVLYRDFTLRAEETIRTEKHSVNGRTWLLSAIRLPSGQVYISATQRSELMRQANVLITLIGLLAVLCLFFVQKNRLTGETFFDKLTEYYLRNSLMNPPQKNRHRAAFALYMGMVLSILSYFLYGWLSGRSVSTSFFYLALAVALTGVFFIYLRNVFNKRVAVLLAGIILTLPLAAHLSLGGFMSGGMGMLMLWSGVAFAVVMFLFDDRVAEAVFGVYVIYLFADVLVEIYLFKNADYNRIFILVSTLFFLGYVFFSAFGIFLTRSEKDYSESVSLLSQLKETQSLLVQKEKMTTLGTLISGIAHEINTPIGAVKASAENLDASLQPLIETLLLYGRDLDEEDYLALSLIMEKSRQSVAEMRSTVESRRERNRLRAFFRDKGFETADALTDRLSRLEINNAEWADEHMYLLRRPNIDRILHMAEILFPFVTGTNTIIFATERISRIVTALRAYVHKQGGRESFDVIKSIENVLCLYDYQLRGAIKVVRDYDDSPSAVIIGSSDELGQVWTNLIQNAIYAMRGEGTLTISIRRDFPWLRVAFTDTGVGIVSEELERIFEPFYTTKPAGEGSGLGLDICRNIVQNHKGMMTAASKPGEGATFEIKLLLPHNGGGSSGGKQ